MALVTRRAIGSESGAGKSLLLATGAKPKSDAAAWTFWGSLALRLGAGLPWPNQIAAGAWWPLMQWAIYSCNPLHPMRPTTKDSAASAF